MIDGSLELFPSNCHICFVLCVILMGCVFARCLFACLVYVGSGRGGIEDVLCLRFRSFSLFRFFLFLLRGGALCGCLRAVSRLFAVTRLFISLSSVLRCLVGRRDGGVLYCAFIVCSSCSVVYCVCRFTAVMYHASCTEGAPATERYFHITYA